MRRIAVGLVLGIAVACLAWHLAGARACEEVPLLGGPVEAEEEGGGGGRALLEEAAVPAESTRLAARGGRSSAPSTEGDRVSLPVNLCPKSGCEVEPPELPDPVLEAVVVDFVRQVLRLRTPWEPRENGDGDFVLVRQGDPVAPGVTERAYAVGAALARLAYDPPEVGRVRSSTSLGDEGRAQALAEQIYARTGEPLWRTQGSWIGWAPFDSDAPLYVRQTAEGHGAVESALDALLTVGGDARTVRVWRGELGPGTLEVGETRRLDASVPWRAAAEGAAVVAPLELDVPADRIVTAFLGEAHAFVADYEIEISQAEHVSTPIYDLAPDGLSVRAHVLPDTEEVEIQLIDAHHAPPLATFSTSLGSGPVSASAPVIIEVPAGPSKRAVVRLPAREGEAWIVGLGGTRAALVEVAGEVEGAGARRPGWARSASLGNDGVPADPDLAFAAQREGAHPPHGGVHAGLVRPSRTQGASPWGYRVHLETEGAGVLTPFGALDRTREEALPFGGSAWSPDRELVLRGGTCVRARWVGGTPGGEAYDVVLSVSEPMGMRHGPPIYGADPQTPSRLPSFRRAVVPMRIVVPHGGVGRRTVTLDLGNGSEPWTVSLSGGERAE